MKRGISVCGQVLVKSVSQSVEHRRSICGQVLVESVRQSGQHKRNPVSAVAAKSMDGGGEPMNEQAVANQWSVLRSELNQLYSKITELEMELSEHSLVIGAIQPLVPSRKCYRLIGGALLERTVGEVLPAVQLNKEGLQEVIARFTEALERKRKEVAGFEVKYKIKIRKADDDFGKEDCKEGAAQGVLVGAA